ncbi:hypothetical protein ACUU9X_04015 [Bacillus cereus]|nr:hypothetical protein [Bacillus cereus]
MLELLIVPAAGLTVASENRSEKNNRIVKRGIDHTYYVWSIPLL